MGRIMSDEERKKDIKMDMRIVEEDVFSMIGIRGQQSRKILKERLGDKYEKVMENIDIWKEVR